MKNFAWLLLAVPAFAQPVETVRVSSKLVEQTVKLPGEFQPYEAVELRARVPGYVERIVVDRGSAVKKGDRIAELSAPEMKAQLAEAQSKARTAESQKAEAEARLASAQSTYSRLKEASATPGAIAGNEIVIAEKTVEGARAAVGTSQSAVESAHASVAAVKDLEAYLNITAPFSGTITERMVHPGALVGPSTGPLVRLEQNARLRLVVSVPEALVGGIVPGGRVSFTVPAYPGKTFTGVVARLPHSLDAKTRTMPVELDVVNSGTLAPGMYPEVSWPVKRGAPSLVVPLTAVVTTTEKTFVIRVTGGKAEWVNVKKGTVSGDSVEVMGSLAAGDVVVKRGTDEIRNGAPIQAKN